MILCVPRTLLFNIKTISRYFREPRSVQRSLTSTQALVLLFLGLGIYHSESSRPATDDAALCDLETFYSSLPTAFDTHPLVWALKAKDTALKVGERKVFQVLVAALPLQASLALEHLVLKVEQLFEFVQTALVSKGDVVTTRKAMLTLKSVSQSQAELLPYFVPSSYHVSLLDIALAFLKINTRSVFLPLGQKSHEENFTLAPILDMANHSSTESEVYTVKVTGSVNGQIKAVPGAGSLELYAPIKQALGPHGSLRRGQEVFLQYGSRDDCQLLIEYGFHLAGTQTSAPGWQGNAHASLSLDSYISRHLTELDSKESQMKVEALKEARYWQNWAVHPHPKLAPSYRTVMALRLLVLDYKGESSGTALPELRRWKLVVSGRLPSVSAANEEAAMSLLLRLGEQAVEDLQARLLLLDECKSVSVESAHTGALRESQDLVRSLLSSQLNIAKGIATIDDLDPA